MVLEAILEDGDPTVEFLIHFLVAREYIRYAQIALNVSQSAVVSERAKHSQLSLSTCDCRAAYHNLKYR